jgi:DNA-nicking Smr family endonuclease
MVPEFDLHGYHKEDALAEIDRELNHAFIQDTDERRLRFITGRGGVLRPTAQVYLREHPLVREVRAEGPALVVLLEDHWGEN